MTNEDDVLARLEKIGHQLNRQPKGRRIAREIGVVALFILLLAGLVTLPNILKPNRHHRYGWLDPLCPHRDLDSRSEGG